MTVNCTLANLFGKITGLTFCDFWQSQVGLVISHQEKLWDEFRDFVHSSLNHLRYRLDAVINILNTGVSMFVSVASHRLLIKPFQNT